MCCYQGARHKALYDAMQAIDPSMPSASEFFHLKGREGDGGVAVSREEAEKALDAVFLAAVSHGSANDDDEDWADVDADERLEQHIAWMKARNELLEDGLTSGQVAALAKYVSDKHAEAEAEKEAEIAKQVRARERKTSTRTKAAIAGLSLLTLASMTGSALGTSNAATPAQDPAAQVQVQDQAGMRSLEGQSFKVGGKTVYIGPVKGKCAPGTVKVQNPKTQVLKWKKTVNGPVTSKKVAKGAWVCKFTNAAGQTATATTVNGVVTSLPSTFPSKPTASDIAALGLTKDTPVSPKLRLPEPSGPSMAPAGLATKVRPVGTVSGVYEVVTPAVKDPLTGSVVMPEQRARFVDVEWEFTGGSGVVAAPGSRQGANGVEATRYVKLNPDGTTRFVQAMPVGARTDGRSQEFFFGEIQPDYGQANLPVSTMKDWTLPAAKDKSGHGMPVGKTANPGYYDSSAGPRDGYVNLTPDGQMFGNYNY